MLPKRPVVSNDDFLYPKEIRQAASIIPLLKYFHSSAQLRLRANNCKHSLSPLIISPFPTCNELQKRPMAKKPKLPQGSLPPSRSNRVFLYLHEYCPNVKSNEKGKSRRGAYLSLSHSSTSNKLGGGLALTDSNQASSS